MFILLSKIVVLGYNQFCSQILSKKNLHPISYVAMRLNLGGPVHFNTKNSGSLFFFYK